MKKIIILACACCIFLTTRAQITLTENDIALPLTKFLSYSDTLPVSLSPGSSGTNQTWVFTSLGNHQTDTIIFTKPEWTPYGSSFPNSNLCLMTINGETSYMYMNLNPDSLNAVGQAGKFAGSPTDILVPISPSQKITDLPSTYQDGFTGTSSFSIVQYVGQSGIDSVKIKDITVTESIFDAWGSITTGLGTFNTLRSKVIQVSTDSVWALMFGTWIDMTGSYGGVDTAKRYSWWTNDIGYMIFEMDVDPLTDSVIKVKYLAAMPEPGGLDPLEISDDINIFPNPASELVHVSTPENTVVVEVYNTSGQLISSEKAGNMVSHIDISGFPSGSYILRLTDNKGFTICHKNLIVE